MALSKSLRFEVFKRDSFTCQYCGRSAPEVLLHADHIDPKANGGEDTILNLVTSCQDCNLGKGARLLGDGALLDRQMRTESVWMNPAACASAHQLELELRRPAEVAS